ncbi:hypothetical protein PCI56_12915 [Plesiomonas shigelloides subsp. oncorhynchi]|nr:hypothetical protein [Plesiomonas shigelloides]MDA1380499.1 hypothetical protein [Plesiomonas shigelloides]
MALWRLLLQHANWLCVFIYLGASELAATELVAVCVTPASMHVYCSTG